MGFVLKDRKSPTTRIIFKQYVGGIDFRYYTKFSVPPIHWDSEKRMLIERQSSRELSLRYKYINSELKRYDDCYIMALNNAQIKGLRITKKYLLNVFDDYFSNNVDKVRRESKHLIIDAFDLTINDSESGIRLTKSGARLSPNRIKRYKTVREHFAKFTDTSILDIDMVFYRKYVAGRNELGKALNTIGAEVSVLKSVIKYAGSSWDILNKIPILNDPEFVAFEEAVENVYVSDAELDILYSLELRLASHRKARDIFVMGCYLGLRVGDLLKIGNNVSTPDDLLRIYSKKGDEFLYLPIHYRVMDILARYNGVFPILSEPVLNRKIKEVCEIAGINELITTRKTVGGKRTIVTVSKYKMITAHTARRSFATNLYLAGIDALTIMKITGHKSERIFMKYICVTKRQVAERMQSHPYFSKK